MFKSRFVAAVAGIAAFAFVSAANAVPVTYNITFTPSGSGVGGSGTFTVDSSAIAMIPATGAYFAPDNSILSFNAVVEGIVFDSVGALGKFTATNGQVSGIVGICCTQFGSSATGAVLSTSTSGGAPTNWSIFDPFGFYVGGGTGPGSYTVSQSVPEPAILAVFGLGLAGLGVATRRRKPD